MDNGADTHSLNFNVFISHVRIKLYAQPPLMEDLSFRMRMCHILYSLLLHMYTSASAFKIVCILFWDTLIQIKFYYLMKLKSFRGDLTDISAKTKTLMYTQMCMPGTGD